MFSIMPYLRDDEARHKEADLAGLLNASTQSSNWTLALCLFTIYWFIISLHCQLSTQNWSFTQLFYNTSWQEVQKNIGGDKMLLKH
jgi:hypothetical protein